MVKSAGFGAAGFGELEVVDGGGKLFLPFGGFVLGSGSGGLAGRFVQLGAFEHFFDHGFEALLVAFEVALFAFEVVKKIPQFLDQLLFVFVLVLVMVALDEFRNRQVYLLRSWCRVFLGFSLCGLISFGAHVSAMRGVRHFFHRTLS